MLGSRPQGVLTMDPLTPKWERVSPMKNMKEKWGIQAPVTLLKSLWKLAIIAGAMYFALGGAQEQLPRLSQQGPFALLQFVQEQAARLIMSAGIAYLLLALADYGYQFWRHEKSLKMSKEEIRKEVKESEGDQILKVRRRDHGPVHGPVGACLLSVSDADVVVTNPTHIAVAPEVRSHDLPGPHGSGYGSPEGGAADQEPGHGLRRTHHREQAAGSGPVQDGPGRTSHPGGGSMWRWQRSWPGSSGDVRR